MQSLPETMVEEGCRAGGDGAILFDCGRAAQATAAWLDARHWGRSGDAARGGRGEVWFLRGPFGEAVLRHYRRGGAIARLVRDRYLWTGADRTRSFREFRLMAELHRRGLPVPRPLVAGYMRSGLFYRADLLSQRVAGARTLAESLPQVLDDHRLLQELGTTLGRFHAQGVSHADLNAHNLLLDDRQRWWLIDFDRGRMRAPQREWQQRRLQRLQRSLLKLGAERSAHWPTAWSTLLEAHDIAAAATP